jgi:hypothetical protein
MKPICRFGFDCQRAGRAAPAAPRGSSEAALGFPRIPDIPPATCAYLPPVRGAGFPRNDHRKRLEGARRLHLPPKRTQAAQPFLGAKRRPLGHQPRHGAACIRTSRQCRF